MLITLPLWLKIISGASALLGLFLLVRSISKILALYNNPNRAELSALLPSSVFVIKVAGTYEIAVKRPSLLGVIPVAVPFRLMDLKTNGEIPVMRRLNLFSQRKNMSGERIVPIAEFTAMEAGSYQLTNRNPEMFKENDRLVVTPKTGVKGLLLIFAILLSAILFIGGTVITVLSFVEK